LEFIKKSTQKEEVTEIPACILKVMRKPEFQQISGHIRIVIAVLAAATDLLGLVLLNSV
jgi:hypothetical protein